MSLVSDVWVFGIRGVPPIGQGFLPSDRLRAFVLSASFMKPDLAGDPPVTIVVVDLSNISICNIGYLEGGNYSLSVTHRTIDIIDSIDSYAISH